MKLPTRILILSMVLAAPATVFAQRGGGTRARSESRTPVRGTINREAVRGRFGNVGIPIYTPAPVFFPFYPGTTIGIPQTYEAPVPSPVVADSTSQVSADEVRALTNQVQALTAEVQRLRSEQVPQYTAVPDPVPVPPDTILVFRDSHRMDIQSYAIIDQTLRVLDKDNSARIALSDLDLDATRKVNQDNGVRFLAPSSLS